MLLKAAPAKLAMALVDSTRIEVTDHRSDLGRWRAAQRPADPRLRDYVLGYFASEGFLPRPLHERRLPLREVSIVLNFAAPAVHRLGRGDPLPYAEGKPYLDCQADDGVRAATQTAIRWADLALDCGYYDQSHFINEFRSFSGLSPLEFLRRTRHE